MDLWKDESDQIALKYSPVQHSDSDFLRYYRQPTAATESKSRPKELLNAWAREHMLTYEHEPCKWIFEWASNLAQGEPRTLKIIPSEPGHDSDLLSPRPLPEFLPTRNPGETNSQYKKRLWEIAMRHDAALKEHEKQMKILQSKHRGRPPGSKVTVADHVSLIYLLCGVPRFDIAIQYKVGETTITKRAQRAAKLIELDYPPPLDRRSFRRDPS